jgi:pantothenate kinase type III
MWRRLCSLGAALVFDAIARDSRLCGARISCGLCLLIQLVIAPFEMRQSL